MQQAAEMSVAAPTIEASLDGRFVSGLKDERVKAAKFYEKLGVKSPSQLVSSPVTKDCLLLGMLCIDQHFTSCCVLAFVSRQK